MEEVQPGATAHSCQRTLARRGSIMLWSACIWVLLVIGIGAFAVDLGKYLYTKAAIRDSIDAAALAASSALERGTDPRAAALSLIAENNLGSVAVDPSRVVVTSGNWNPNSKVFSANGWPTNAVSVASTQDYSGGIFSRPSASIHASAIAHFQQRDIILVLDFSGSMNQGTKADSLRAAVNDFADVVSEISGGRDRVAMVRYADTASISQSFTADMTALKTKMASEAFSGATNIGDAFKLGIDTIQSQGRSGAEKLIVLLTDGLANRPTNVDPQQYVRDEANRAKTLKLPVYSVSFGIDADQVLMQYVADTAGTTHYHIDDTNPGVNSALRTTFREIAAARGSHFVR